MAGILVSCADTTNTDDDRRFANDPVSTDRADATEPRAVSTEVVAAATGPPQLDQGPLLRARGAPATIYALSEGSIHLIDAGSLTVTKTVSPNSGTIFEALAPSPSGDRVAVVARTGTRVDISIFDDRGSEITVWQGVVELDRASPEPAEAPIWPNSTISWSASGSELLVVTGGDSLVSVNLTGGPEVIPIPQNVDPLVAASWSPRGDKIAMLGHDSEGRGVLWTFAPNIDGESLKRLDPPDLDSSDLGSVRSFAWLPDATGIVYLMSEGDDLGAPGGQLYFINATTGERRVVASAGRVSPAAEIVAFAVSPDGKSIAYGIAVPEGRRWHFDSLWVKRVSGSATQHVPVDVVDELAAIQWVKGGLIVERLNRGVREWVYLVPDAEPAVVQEATPGASPVYASPDAATPVGGLPHSATPEDSTPVSATPVASPVLASPVPAASRSEGQPPISLANR